MNHILNSEEDYVSCDIKPTNGLREDKYEIKHAHGWPVVGSGASCHSLVFAHLILVPSNYTHVIQFSLPCRAADPTVLLWWHNRGEGLIEINDCYKGAYHCYDSFGLCSVVSCVHWIHSLYLGKHAPQWHFLLSLVKNVEMEAFNFTFILSHTVYWCCTKLFLSF